MSDVQSSSGQKKRCFYARCRNEKWVSSRHCGGGDTLTNDALNDFVRISTPVLLDSFSKYFRRKVVEDLELLVFNILGNEARTSLKRCCFTLLTFISKSPEDLY